MQSLWDEKQAAACEDDLALRVYSSNLLGANDTLVLHGGGNTSVKIDDILYVKGSGWDLSSIKKEGFAPVKLKTLLNMAKKTDLSDSDMVRQQREAMTNQEAPNPSVEAILHALIPFKFVDHTHADAIVTLSNSQNGKAIIKELYSNFLIVDYIMPGFELAHAVYEQTKDKNWSKIEGIILHHHGIFTFDNDAKKSYEKMIDAVTLAEAYLDTHAALTLPTNLKKEPIDTKHFTSLISEAKGYEVSLKIDQSVLARLYASQAELKNFASRGVLTPEHIIRTKRTPLIIEDSNYKEAIQHYIKEYEAYFKRHATNEIMLNPAPNYMIIQDRAVVSFGKTQKEADVIADIVSHTMKAVLQADKLGGYKSINEAQSFAMEYWELEQAKLKK